jgi:hypothetical protein
VVEKKKTKSYVNGSRPSHVHTCNGGELPHTWECNSPYCAYQQSLCPEDGGAEPIEEGREPWKGR